MNSRENAPLRATAITHEPRYTSDMVNVQRRISSEGLGGVSPYICTAVQAEEKLHELGIDPEKLCIDEWEDEEEFDEEVEGEGEETPPDKS